MKRHTPQSSGSKVVVGRKPIWQLWAESVKNPTERGEQLRAAGAFTVEEFSKLKGWPNSKTKHYLTAQKLHSELVADPKAYHCQLRRLYLPPGVTPPA